MEGYSKIYQHEVTYNAVHAPKDEMDVEMKPEGGQSAADDERPPYNVLVPQAALPKGYDDQRGTLQCIFVALSRERTLPSTSMSANELPDFDLIPVEMEALRIHAFMALVLCVDYELATGIAMPTELRNHFVAMGQWFIALYQTNKHNELSIKDINRLAPRLIRHVHTPTHVLRVKMPIDILATTCVRFVRVIERHGVYQSSVESVLQQDGTARLAEKLFFDEWTLCKEFPEGSLRTTLQNRIDTAKSRYFLTIQRPGKGVWTKDRGLDWDRPHRVPYTLNDAGRKYEKAINRREKRLRRLQLLLGWTRWRSLEQ